MEAQKVEKAEMAVSADQMVVPQITGNFLAENKNRRGLNIYYFTELQGITGRAKSGRMMTGTVERPLFGLTIEDRIDIFKRCDVIFGIVTSRMNKVSGMEWTIERKSKIEDRIAENLKSCQQLFGEYGSDDLKEIVFRARLYQIARQDLFDLKPDFSNFTTSMLRWRRRVKNTVTDKSQEIVDWLSEPNIEDTFPNYLKKWTYDFLVHGAFSQYKEFVEGRLENFYGLPGGSVMPMKGKYVGGGHMYVQMIQGMDAKIYFDDELSFQSYVPASGLSYGHIPLEALVNKVAESLLFDSLCAERADGTKPPEKAVIFGGSFPFGELTGAAGEDHDMPVPVEEQKRIETQLNEPRKNAIRTLTGMGSPLVLDLSKADTFAGQQERQRAIREVVALVYGATPMEMNMGGSEGTSGRSTAEEQRRIDRERSIFPILQSIEDDLNRDKIPQRFPSTYKFNFKSGMSEKEQLEIERMMMDAGTYAVNEIRSKRGDDPFPDKQFDIPQGGTKPPDGSQGSPLNTKEV